MIVRCSACCAGRVGRVGRAVVEPRIDVVRHVHDVDAAVARVGERVDRRLEQEEARVLAGADVDELDARGDAADADPVQRGADRARPRACRGRRRRRRAGRRTRATSHGPSSMPVTGLSTVKLRLSARLKFGAMSGWLPSTPVSMTPTRTACGAGLGRVGARRRRADHRHVPLQAGQLVAAGRAAGAADGVSPRDGAFSTRVARGLRSAAGIAADRRCCGGADDGGLGPGPAREVGPRRAHGGDADVAVEADDRCRRRRARPCGPAWRSCPS